MNPITHLGSLCPNNAHIAVLTNFISHLYSAYDGNFFFPQGTKLFYCVIFYYLDLLLHLIT